MISAADKVFLCGERKGPNGRLTSVPCARWEELMAGLGYAPLEEFFLAEKTP